MLHQRYKEQTIIRLKKKKKTKNLPGSLHNIIYFNLFYETIWALSTPPLLVGISIAEVSSLDNYSSFPAAITARAQVS